MADHEVLPAELHQQFPNDEAAHKSDIAGGDLTTAPAAPVARAVSSDADSHKGSFDNTPDGDEPTIQEKATLRHVGESLPLSAWLVAVVELCERFTYYGVQGLFQNYEQRPLDGSLGRGALGLGQRGATGLTTFFQFWCYVTPILGAIVADQYLGKYKTILIFCGVYILGLLILVVTSLPSSLEHGAGLGGFVVAIIVIGVGTGGIKSNVAPLIADQYTRKKMAVHTTPKGERIILDPAVTYQQIYMIFYWCINVGSLSLLATPYMEKNIGFWSAYLLALCMFLVGFVVLVLGKSKYVVRPPQGSVITNAFRCWWIMIKNRNTDAPKPSFQARQGHTADLRWDDHFVDEVKRALVAMKVFVVFPVFWVVYGQFSSNFVSQAGEMEGHGIPNDLMQNFDPISIIVAIPILDRLIYPVLQKAHIQFRPITRITVGFCISALAMAYAAIVQHLIYVAPPCYGAPLACSAGLQPDGTYLPNNVHIAVQTPAYIFIGLSEVFLSVTGLEYAYTKAPPSMKSFVQSMYLLTNAFGAAVLEGLTPLLYDPAILWMFVGLSVASIITAVGFWTVFHPLNNQEDEMNALEAREEEEDEVMASVAAADAEKKV